MIKPLTATNFHVRISKEYAEHLLLHYGMEGVIMCAEYGEGMEGGDLFASDIAKEFNLRDSNCEWMIVDELKIEVH